MREREDGREALKSWGTTQGTHGLQEGQVTRAGAGVSVANEVRDQAGTRDETLSPAPIIYQVNT